MQEVKSIKPSVQSLREKVIELRKKAKNANPLGGSSNLTKKLTTALEQLRQAKQEAKQTGSNVKPNSRKNKNSNNQPLRITSSNNAAKNKLAGNLGINIQTLNKLTKNIEKNPSKGNITTNAILNYIVEARKTGNRNYSLNSNENIELTANRAIRQAKTQNNSNNNNYGSLNERLLAANLEINIQTLNKLTKIIEKNPSKGKITTNAILKYIAEARKTGNRNYSLKSNEKIELTVNRAIREAKRQNNSNNNNYGSLNEKLGFNNKENKFYNAQSSLNKNNNALKTAISSVLSENNKTLPNNLNVNKVMKMIKNTPNFNYNGNLKSSIRKILNAYNEGTRKNMVPVAGPTMINNPEFNAPPTINTLRTLNYKLRRGSDVPVKDLQIIQKNLSRVRAFLNSKRKPNNRNKDWMKMNATYKVVQSRLNKALRKKF